MAAEVSKTANDEVWKKGARASMGSLSPLAFLNKPALKTLEAELQRQLAHAHGQLQRDLDLLHEQVHAEVHAAISKELHGVARRLAEVAQGADACRREVEPMRGTMQQLVQEAQWTRQRLEADLKEARDATQEAARQASAASGEFSAAVEREASALRGEMAALKEQLAQELVSQLQQARDAGEEAQGAQRRELEQAAAGQTRWLEELTQEAAKVKGEVDEEREARLRLAERLEPLEAGLAGLQASAAGAAGAAGAAHATEVEAALGELGAALRGEAQVGEARFQELQAAVAAVEGRLVASLREGLDAAQERSEASERRVAEAVGEDLRGRLHSLTGDVKEKLVALGARVERLDAECSEGLDFAGAGWARAVEWRAALDPDSAPADGQDVESPPFAAAGLRGLRLRLRLQPAGRGDGAGRRWACGAFLCAPEGRVSFRLHLCGRSQTFAGDFAEAPEWGSQRIAVLEHPGAEVLVRLELLDVSAQIRPRGCAQPELSATLQIVDAAETAAREVARLRSALVRRVEWRIARASERLAAVRAAAASDGDAAFEPLCSPPFAAAGVEGLQLQLYPLGYRARGDESCGFFLVAPRGTYVRCRAFVGDASRNFENHFDAQEPYGRGSFCRLADKIGEDDTVTCGVEFLEVRQEQTIQVRGGPFGNVADQMKVVSGPANGGMEVVRELREVQGAPRDAGPPARPRPPRQRLSAADRTAPVLARPSAGQLTVSKSLPVLLPAVGGGTAGPGMATYTAGTPTRRQADLTPMH